MKVLTIFLTLFLWLKTTQAAIIKQNEPFMEIKTAPADNPGGEQKGEKRHDTEKVTNKEGAPLNETDFYNAKSINTSSPDFKAGEDPTLRAGLFEGDIDGINVTNMLRNAIRNTDQRWPDAKIPYVIADSYGSKARAVIARAMEEYQKKTCIKFVPKTSDDKDYVNIMKDQGCTSKVGRVGGAQKLSLARECLTFGTILHELMHAVGFLHEQSRTDRDDYITIVWDNVKKGGEDAFHKYSSETIQDLGEAYDYASIMHYDPYSYAEDPSQPTIISKDKSKSIESHKKFSETDIRKINKLYECPASKTGGGDR